MQLSLSSSFCSACLFRGFLQGSFYPENRRSFSLQLILLLPVERGVPPPPNSPGLPLVTCPDLSHCDWGGWGGWPQALCLLLVIR